MRHLARVCLICAAALSIAVPAIAGTYNQPPFWGNATVQPGEAGAVEGVANFKRGTTCVVGAVGQSNQFMLYILDKRGKVVAQSVGDYAPNGGRVVFWKPTYTGPFIIRLVSVHPGPQQILAFSN